MGRLVMVEFLTVDGVTQGVGSPGEDTEGGFARGGWGAPFAHTIHELTAKDGFGATSSYLFGRRTYEKMADFWPHQPDSDPIAAHMNSTPKYVASTTLRDPEWSGTEVLGVVDAAAVDELKRANEGDVVILGSGALARQLLEQHLVDQLRLFIHPLLLGAGKRLFGGLPTVSSLTLQSVARTELGTVGLVYDIVR